MSTSKTYQQSLADAGSENRPPMLERGSYIPWASRFRRYLNRKRDNRKWLLKALDEGPYEFKNFVPEGSTIPRLQTAEDLEGDDLLLHDAEMEVMNMILLSIPNEIYNSVDACTSAKDMWKRVERLMRGTIQNKVDRETRFTNEFDQFVAEPGEALVSVYNRFAQLMNDLERNNMNFPTVTINTKFLNSLQPEWLKYVTQVRLAKQLTVDSFDDLFDYLQQFEKLVNASRAKKLEKSHDPLALVANTGSSSRQTSSYYVTHPTSVVDYDDEYQQDDVHNNSEDPLVSAMLLLAKAITQNFSNPTNNHLCASSNTINQAIIQGNRGMNAPNETGNVQRTLRTPSSGNTLIVQCYNYNGKGHYARNCPKPRVRDSKYFMEQMLLAKQDEGGVILTDEQNDFLFADASWREEIEELSANICLMAKIQPVDQTSDDGASCESAFISEVQSSSIDENNEQLYPTHTKIINNTIDLEAKLKKNIDLILKLGNLEIPLNVRDSEDTLEDAFKSKLKMTEKINDPIAVANKQNCWTINYKKLNPLYKDFVPQKELSVEHKYFASSSIPSVKILNCKRASIFYTSPAEIQINDFCQDQVKPILNEFKVYLEFFRNVFQRDIKETKDVFESIESELDELEKQNDLLKDQLLEASLKHNVELCVLLNHEWVDKILSDELDQVKKKSFEIQEGLQSRIKFLKKMFKDVKSKLEKLENESVSLDFKVQSLIKERDNVKIEYQKLFDSIKKTRSQTQKEMDELIVHVSEKTYAYGAIRAENQDLLSTISELKTRLEKVEKGKSVNTKFDKTNGSQSLLCVTPLNKHAFQKKTDVSKTEENHVVSKPVTLQTSSNKQTGANQNKNVIKPGMYRVVTTQESQINKTKSGLSSTGVNATSRVRRPMSKDSSVTNSVLVNSKKAAKNVSVYVRKNKQKDNTSANVISNKENVIDVDVANASKAKTLLCVSCMQNVLIPCHDKCLAKHKLNVRSNVRRTFSTNSRTPKSLETTYVAPKTRFSKKETQSKTLDTTSVVSKSKIDVESASKAKDKVSSASRIKKTNLRDKPLSTFIKNKIRTSRIWKKWFESQPNVIWTPVNIKQNVANTRSSEKPSVSIKKWVVKLPSCPSVVSSYVAVGGLGHNLFSVGQFCDGDLEVAFRSNTCYVRNLEGDDLLTGGRDSNLYTISISDMAASSPVCLMSKATSTKSWLWHRRLSHLNFGTINDLSRLDLVDDLPKFKYQKDHLCSAYEMGKSKKASHPPKLVPSDYSKLE
ncbi:integrase, catalytic region, zinc finger, CCHC-type containing protein [Tanacetum coccineum]